MRAFKFLTADGSGVFSGFAWPLPDGAPGAWVESEVDPCRSGIHACRPSDLPYWLADAGPVLRLWKLRRCRCNGSSGHDCHPHHFLVLVK